MYKPRWWAETGSGIHALNPYNMAARQTYLWHRHSVSLPRKFHFGLRRMWKEAPNTFGISVMWKHHASDGNTVMFKTLPRCPSGSEGMLSNMAANLGWVQPLLQSSNLLSCSRLIHVWADTFPSSSEKDHPRARHQHSFHLNRFQEMCPSSSFQWYWLNHEKFWWPVETIFITFRPTQILILLKVLYCITLHLAETDCFFILTNSQTTKLKHIYACFISGKLIYWRGLFLFSHAKDLIGCNAETVFQSPDDIFFSLQWSQEYKPWRVYHTYLNQLWNNSKYCIFPNAFTKIVAEISILHTHTHTHTHGSSKDGFFRIRFEKLPGAIWWV